MGWGKLITLLYTLVELGKRVYDYFVRRKFLRKKKKIKVAVEDYHSAENLDEKRKAVKKLER